jgi:hypothetical protein
MTLSRKKLSAYIFIILFSFPVFGKIPSVGYNDGYQPQQPLPYDHSLHAGKYQIPCLNCHVGATRNRHALVPSTNACMNCHQSVAVDRPAIQKLAKAHEKGYGIPWLKVHLLPDFVMFNHQPHMEGGVRCQTCHGPIETMKEVYQHSDLSMGWCVNCHREPSAARDLGWMNKTKVDEVTKQAPTSCGTCHY